MFDVGDVLLGNWTGDRLFRVQKVNKDARRVELKDLANPNRSIITDALKLYQKKKEAGNEVVQA